ncbi:unnamed protein product [Rotaria sp. Silwood1]|nr:unnamed protein product [Rotaria sp. Silwood1]
MYINRGCTSLFIHVDNTLYCSIRDGHQIVKISLDSKDSTWSNVAGMGCAGSTEDMLDQPFGIYVNDNYDLYVADTGNDRIQLFHHGESKGITVAGRTLGERFALDKPSSIMLDADNNLFIVDSGNQRIVRVGANGFRCLIGCSKTSCREPNQLCHPLTAAFDSYGNIFITNQYMNGIQKFVLSKDSCTSFVNKPKLSECASWYSSGITVANSSTTDLSPFTSFISINNTLYVADQTTKTIHIWPEKSENPTKTIYSSYNFSTGFFVTLTGDIYIDNENSSHISKWSLDKTSTNTTMYINRGCISLFIHVDNSLYCSIHDGHQIVKISLDSNDSTWSNVAGMGCAGSTEAS